MAYAFCVLAPAGALAVVSSPTVFHCIGELNAMAAPGLQQTATHVHDGGTSHHRHGYGAHDRSGAADHHADVGDKTHDNESRDNKDHGGTCCGLFCVSALAHDSGLTFGVSTPTTSATATMVNGLTGRAPVPLHRPPKA